MPAKLVATTWRVTVFLGVPPALFAQAGPMPEDIKKSEDSNDVLGFAGVASRALSPTVGELGYFKTYDAASKKAADLLSVKVVDRRIFARVETSWDFDGRANNDAQARR
jgi:hypothetical protein